MYADTRSQVYRGVAAETPQTDAAVAAPPGRSSPTQGSPAITYFFASSGGTTENIENSFLGSAPRAVAARRGRPLRPRARLRTGSSA